MIFCSIGRWQQLSMANIVKVGDLPFCYFLARIRKFKIAQKYWQESGMSFFVNSIMYYYYVGVEHLSRSQKWQKLPFCANKCSKAAPLNHWMKCCCVEIQRTKSKTANLMCNVDYFPSWSICQSEIMLWIIQSPKSHWF